MYYDPQLRIGVFGCSRQGASHRRSAPPVPCQDAFHFSSGTIAGQSYLVAVVADGHGDKKYERSSIGSHLATQAAINVFLRFLSSSDGSVPLSESGENKHDIVRCFRGDFALALYKEWKSLVKEHIERFPHVTFPIGSEESAASPVPYQLYGTTLLFTAVIDGVILLAKIGDGDIMILKKDDSYEVPPDFDENPKHVGGTTDSLCSPNAVRNIKTWSRQGADYLSTIKAITISTDGLSNAVEEDDFPVLLSQIVGKVSKESADFIPDKLDEFSLIGSGDDVTLVGLCFGESLEKIAMPTETAEIVNQPTPKTFNVFLLVDCSRSMRDEKNDRVKQIASTLNEAFEEMQEQFPELKIELSNPIRFTSNVEGSAISAPHDSQNLSNTNNLLTLVQAIDKLRAIFDTEIVYEDGVSPLCILLSDGLFADAHEEYETAIKKLNEMPWGKKSHHIAIAIGKEGEYNEDKLALFSNTSPAIFMSHNVSELRQFVRDIVLDHP